MEGILRISDSDPCFLQPSGSQGYCLHHSLILETGTCRSQKAILSFPPLCTSVTFVLPCPLLSTLFLCVRKDSKVRSGERCDLVFHCSCKWLLKNYVKEEKNHKCTDFGRVAYHSLGLFCSLHVGLWIFIFNWQPAFVIAKKHFAWYTAQVDTPKWNSYHHLQLQRDEKQRKLPFLVFPFPSWVNPCSDY